MYKDTKDLIGWEILGGAFEPFTFVDPFTGKEYTLFNELVHPTLQKGNRPGNFPGAEDLRYFQKYHGLVLSFARRFRGDWALNASYTWSRSSGLIPRMLSAIQFDPFYSSREGSDPNNYLNAEGRLQGDRPHMFRAQVVFFKLPWDLQASATMEFSSGRAHNRQIRVFELNQSPTPSVIMEPSGSLRYSAINNIDLSIGKRVAIGDRLQVRVDAQIFNLLNSDQELFFTSLVLQDPGDTFVPDTWVKPRRLQVRLGLEF